MQGYEVLRKLADGSAAEVFLAREEASDDRVLLEVIRPELTLDAGAYNRFLERARERQALTHPNLVRRKSAGRAPDGRIFVVTEPVPGEHLGSVLLTQGPLSVEEMVRTVVPICDALSYLHEHQVVHGYLRPSNVYPGDRGLGRGPKLVDTGLLLLRSEMKSHSVAPLVLVEPEYLCPERIRGKRGDVSSDVYGLGVLMFELLTGLAPFSGPSPEETRRRHLVSAVPPLPDSAARIANIVQRCLQKDPAERYPSVAAVRQALAYFLTDSGSHTPRDLERTHGGVAPRQLSLRTPVPRSVRSSHTPPPPPDSAVLNPASPQTLNERAAMRVGNGRVLSPGERLGNFEIGALLGEGGMGRVYVAKHLKLGRQVALKVLHPDQARDPSQLQRFFHEARAVNQIAHEHIVEISDFVEDAPDSGGHVYCVMEYLKGVSLKQLAAAEPLSVKRIVHLLAQVCDALGAAHRLDVVHRDVKPDNIFVLERGGEKDYVKVLDFGVAKLLGDGDEVDFSVTRPGMVVGTPTYMSPEQASGKHIDARSDIHAVGAVLYQLLGGRAPFEAHSLGQLIVNIVTVPARPLLALTVHKEPIPSALRDVVMRCLAKSPEDRFPSMEALRNALLDSIREDAVEVSTEFSGVGTEAYARAETEQNLPIPKPAARKPWLAIGLAVLAVATVTFAAVRTHGFSKRPDSLLGSSPVPGTTASVPGTGARVPGTGASSPGWTIPTSVRIEVTSKPSAAHVIRADTHEELGVTPLTVNLLRADAAVILGISVTGYVTEQRTVRLDQNAAVEVVLSPQPGKKAALKRALSRIKGH